MSDNKKTGKIYDKNKSGFFDSGDTGVRIDPATGKIYDSDKSGFLVLDTQC